ncbi:protein monoglycylase TTLL8-like [Daktulosphaira vitifoliae]|uniref:protein monoglycylase TTLL8-like n=1 Tax=Daktulosphaira vitifoliae TaxID=58002 RepID=UPI0021A9EA4E|nr:protein monoglycylase TTLL8-like [Daktulosphaira vitifoliae]
MYTVLNNRQRRPYDIKKKLRKRIVENKTHYAVKKIIHTKYYQNVGTVDQVIKERKIFKILGKMPSAVRTSLLNNGWIEKMPEKTRRDTQFYSLHENVQRAKAVSNKYEAGLLWLDDENYQIDWTRLDPDTIVNRFPRNNNIFKLCSNSMAVVRSNICNIPGQFDKFYPRTYSTDIKNVSNHIILDYCITACVSLLKLFISKLQIDKSTENGEVPLSSVQFALRVCRLIFVDRNQVDTICYKDSEWNYFFENYYKVAHYNKNFIVSKKDQQIANDLKCNIEVLIDKISVLSPQTVIDGFKNIWIVKSKFQSNRNPILLNKIEDIISTCENSNNCDHVVQKYIETPALAIKTKFSIIVWIIISTLNNNFTIWLYQNCCIRFCLHDFSLTNFSSLSHFTNPKSKLTINSVTRLCSLKRLNHELYAVNINKKIDHLTLILKIRQAIITSVTASFYTTNCRPNSIELFQTSFILDENFNPWLIEIKSDPRLSLKSHSLSSVVDDLEKGFAKMIIEKCQQTKFGLFNLIYEDSMSQNYKPCKMIYEKIPIMKHIKNKRDISQKEQVQQCNGWDNFELVGGTYIEQIQVNEENNNELQTEKFKYNFKLLNKIDILESKLIKQFWLSNLQNAMKRLNSKSKINENEAIVCLSLLEKWKERVRSVQNFYKKILIKTNTQEN